MGAINDFGIRISRFGFDVKTAPDFELILNSSWPSLKIGLQGSFTWTAVLSGPDLVVATHSLGYPPAFQIFSPTGLGGGTFGVPPGSTYYSSNEFYIDNSKLYVTGSFGTPGTVYTVYYYIFRQALDQTFTAPNVNTVGIVSGATGTDYGLKIAKSGKSITSTDLRDYVIHSGTQELGIAQIFHNTSTPSPWVVTHNLGYLPVYLFFVDGAGTGSYTSYNSVRSTADNNSITFKGAQSILPAVCTAVIFKDPVLSV